MTKLSLIQFSICETVKHHKTECKARNLTPEGLFMSLSDDQMGR